MGVRLPHPEHPAAGVHDVGQSALIRDIHGRHHHLATGVADLLANTVDIVDHDVRHPLRKQPLRGHLGWHLAQSGDQLTVEKEL